MRSYMVGAPAGAVKAVYNVQVHPILTWIMELIGPGIKLTAKPVKKLTEEQLCPWNTMTSFTSSPS
jgi:hypothetical protein